MKKKLMMVAVLLGALSLGACVDGNESQSVTDLRNAKAAQLNAVAALYQAQAESEALIGAAEAQLRQAEAALKQAQASQIEEEIRQAQEEFNYQIAALQAKWEAKLAYWNSMKAQYEGDLWKNESDAVQAVYKRYTNALDQVYTLNSSLMRQQIYKAQLQTNQITAEEAVNQTIAGLNEDLADEQRRLAKLQAIQAATPSMDEYLAMMDDLEKQAYDIVNNKATAALADEQSKRDAYETPFEAVDNGESYVVVPAIETLNQLASDYDNPTAGVNTRSFVDFEYGHQFAEDARTEYQNEYGWGPEGTFSMNIYEFDANQIEAATLQLNQAFEAQLKADDAAIESATGEAWKKDNDGNIIYGSETYTVNGAQGEIDY